MVDSFLSMVKGLDLPSCIYSCDSCFQKKFVHRAPLSDCFSKEKLGCFFWDQTVSKWCHNTGSIKKTLPFYSNTINTPIPIVLQCVQHFFECVFYKTALIRSKIHPRYTHVRMRITWRGRNVSFSILNLI